jgi:SEC-C motif
MRLTEEQIRQGLLHDDQGVRQCCLDYFADKYSNNETVMPLVVQAFDARGLDAFEHCSSIADLKQTDETIEWTIRSLTDSPSLFGDQELSDFREQLLCKTEARLLQRHQDSILKRLEPKRQASVRRRLQFLSEAPTSLWERLQSICEEHTSAKEWNDFPHAEVEDLVTSLAEFGDVPVDRMMELLRQDFDDEEESALMWLEPYLIRLAGLIRHEPVLPILIEKLRIGADSVNEESQAAMIRIGTDEVVRRIEETFPEEDWSWQLFASSVFGCIHSDEAERAATELLRVESLSLDIHQNIATGLGSQHSLESIQTIFEFLDSHIGWLDDPEWSVTLDQIRTTLLLTGSDTARHDEYRRQLDEAIQSERASIFNRGPKRTHGDEAPWNADGDYDDGDLDDDDEIPSLPPPSTIAYDAPHVGRNDLCLYGSGKKFKKCCMNKTPVK